MEVTVWGSAETRPVSHESKDRGRTVMDLDATAATYALALELLRDKVPEGYRLLFIRADRHG